MAGLTLDGVAWAFTHVHASNWHPLTWISHMLDCQMYGLNPAGHHFTSVAIHAATAALLFLVVRNMTGRLWPAAFVAAVFAVHPLRVESVAWVAERKDVLSGLFFVLMLGAYLRYARRPWSAARYAAVLILFTCGLLSKPMLVTAPFILLLLDYWPLNRFGPPLGLRSRVILEKLPFVALAVASSLATLWAQRGALQTVQRIPLPLRLGNAVISCVDYLGQMLWPSNLAIFYPWDASRITIVRLLIALGLLLVVSALVLFRRQQRYLATGWLWYLIMLGPVIGILQVGIQARADRYTYLPQIGITILITWLVVDLTSRRPSLRLPIGIMATFLVAALAFSARIQASYWRDSEALWRHALACTRQNTVAEGNLAQACFTNGKTDEAMFHFEQALRIEPTEATIHSGLGSALLKLGRRREALNHLKQAIDTDPNLVSARCSLGVALLEEGRAEESIEQLRAAIAIDPDRGDAHYNLGNSYLQMRRSKEALIEYAAATRVNPNDLEALNNTAWVLATSPDGSVLDGTKAVVLAERANSLSGGRNQIVVATLAAAYAEAGRLPEAIATVDLAIQLANAEGNEPRVSSLRSQLETYKSGNPFRDVR